MTLTLAQAAVNDANIHFDRLYSYTIPTQLVGRVFPGSMVLVPFGRGDKARMAVVLAVEEVDEADAPKRLKTLYDAAPEDARLTPDLLELVRFLRERTFCTWFEAVKAVIPYGAQYRPAVVDGKHTQAVLIMDSDHVILSGIPLESITGRAAEETEEKRK